MNSHVWLSSHLHRDLHTGVLTFTVIYILESSFSGRTLPPGGAHDFFLVRVTVGGLRLRFSWAVVAYWSFRPLMCSSCNTHKPLTSHTKPRYNVCNVNVSLLCTCDFHIAIVEARLALHSMLFTRRDLWMNSDATKVGHTQQQSDLQLELYSRSHEMPWPCGYLL